MLQFHDYSPSPDCPGAPVKAVVRRLAARYTGDEAGWADAFPDASSLQTTFDDRAPLVLVLVSVRNATVEPE